ncbi:UPF0147 family protein [Candidatus Woesearchaeota archaeon]|nr:UPF0147 family protein [Candidatus Woesearchaeota archaeon]
MELKEVISALKDLEQDISLPKNIKLKVSNMVTYLKGDADMSLKVNKSLNELDEISSDINLPTFIRTQIWGIASMLEKLQ